MNEVTGGRLITPIDNGPHSLPRYTFDTGPVPEPKPFREDMFGCPVPPIDCRPISFEIRRRKVALCNNDAFPIDYDFDLLDVLDSELLNELDPIDPVLKDKIRALSFQERADLKAQILDGNSWLTEFVPPSMACLVCNTAGSFLYN